MDPRFKIRPDVISPAHTSFTLFANGANCGQVVMRNEEYVAFSQMLQQGARTSNASLEFDRENIHVSP